MIDGNYHTATNYAALSARFNPVPNGRGAELCRAGKVIQVGVGRSSVRMSVREAREFAAALLDMASPMLPHQELVVKYKPPGRKHHRSVRLPAGRVLEAAGCVMAACRAAEAKTLFAGVRG